jgi:hypothetical protein
MSDATAVAVTSVLARALRDEPACVHTEVGRRLPEVEPAALRPDKLTAPYGWLLAGSRDVTGTPWAAEVRRQRRRAAVLAHELTLVTRRLDDTGIPFAVLRGPALASCYPPGWPREANDIDLLLPSVNDVAPALAALQQDGYVVGRPMVCRRDPRAGGAWVGLALRRARPDLEHPMYLDLAVSGPAAGRTACVSVGPAAWAGRTRVPVRDTTVPVFAPTTLALIFAVELLERDAPIGRDLLDFVALTRRKPDWAAVRVQVRRYGVGRGLAALAELAARAGLAEEGELLRWLGAGRRRPAGSLRRACLGLVDRAYARMVRSAPNATLRLIEHAPVRVWYRLGLPVYGYPPSPTRGELAGAAGRPVAGVPHFRARVRPVARAEEVDEIFPSIDPVDAGCALTEPELTSWQEHLVDQLVAAAPDGEADRAYLVDAVARQVVADGGTDGTLGVRRDGELVAAGRVVDCLHPLTKRRDRRVEGLWAQPDAVQTLLRLVPDDQPLRVTLPVRGPAEQLAEPLRAAGFQPELVTVRRAVSNDHDVKSTVEIYAATVADLPFVQQCLAVAVRRGLFGQPPEVDVDEWVRGQFAEAAGPDIVCLVARDGAQLIGHGYARLVADRYRPGQCAFIVDVFVIPQRHGEGHSHALTAALGSAVAVRGVSVLESEVALRGDVSALRANLAASGWVEDHMVWVREAR